MTPRPEIDEATLALVRSADPLATDACVAADEEAALRHVLEHIDALEALPDQGQGERSRGGRVRPGVLACAFGLVGVGVALVLALMTSATPRAYAITTHRDGSVLVQLDGREDLGQANHKLAEMGIDEQITLYTRPDPAAVRGPVACRPGPGAGPPDPPVRVLVGTGSSTSGQSSGNSGEESVSRLACIVGPHSYPGRFPASTGTTGNTGRG